MINTQNTVVINSGDELCDVIEITAKSLDTSIKEVQLFIDSTKTYPLSPEHIGNLQEILNQNLIYKNLLVDFARRSYDDLRNSSIWLFVIEFFSIVRESCENITTSLDHYRQVAMEG